MADKKRKLPKLKKKKHGYHGKESICFFNFPQTKALGFVKLA